MYKKENYEYILKNINNTIRTVRKNFMLGLNLNIF